MQMWESKVTPLQEWLKKQETSCEALQNVPDDFESVIARISEVQVFFLICNVIILCSIDTLYQEEQLKKIKIIPCCLHKSAVPMTHCS